MKTAIATTLLIGVLSTLSWILVDRRKTDKIIETQKEDAIKKIKENFTLKMSLKKIDNRRDYEIHYMDSNGSYLF